MGLEPEKSTAGASLAREYLSRAQIFYHQEASLRPPVKSYAADECHAVEGHVHGGAFPFFVEPDRVNMFPWCAVSLGPRNVDHGEPVAGVQEIPPDRCARRVTQRKEIGEEIRPAVERTVSAHPSVEIRLALRQIEPAVRGFIEEGLILQLKERWWQFLDWIKAARCPIN
jgi:hypothetical protein